MRKGRTEEKGSTVECGRGVWRDRSKQEVEDKEKLGERAGETGRASYRVGRREQEETGWGRRRLPSSLGGQEG